MKSYKYEITIQLYKDFDTIVEREGGIPTSYVQGIGVALVNCTIVEKLVLVEIDSTSTNLA